MILIKMLSLIFQQWFGWFTMLLVGRFSGTRLFRHLSDYVFGGRNLANTKSMKVIFFSKYLKFTLYFKNEGKKGVKVSCFWDNWIWIGIVKLSLVRAGYFSLAGIVLTSSHRIWLMTNKDFFQVNCLGRDQWIWLRCYDGDFNSAWARLSCCFSKGRLKREFLDIYLTTFSESVILEIKNLWGSSFFQNI